MLLGFILLGFYFILIKLRVIELLRIIELLRVVEMFIITKMLFALIRMDIIVIIYIFKLNE